MVGFLKKFSSKLGGGGENIDVDEFLETIGVEHELLNIEPLYKRNSIKLKQAVSELKGNARAINGDIVRVTEYKLLLTPKGIKVAKQKTK